MVNRLKKEHIAWLLLMGSFVLAVLCALGLRGDMLSYFRSQEFSALMAQVDEVSEQANLGEAERLLSEIVARYPKREEALLRYAQFLEGREQNAAAEEWYRRAACVGRQRFSAVRRYAAFLDRQDRSKEALPLYVKYLNRHPEDYAAQLDLGQRLLVRGRLEEAVPRLLDARKDPYVCAEAERSLGKAYQRLGRWEDAVAAWRRLTGMNGEPGRNLHWQDIAEAYVHQGRVADAIVAWEKFLHYFPNSAHAVRQLRRLYERQRDFNALARMDLYATAVRPEIEIGKPLNWYVWLEGVSHLPTQCCVGKTVQVMLHFGFAQTVHKEDALQLQFYLSPSDGAVELLSSAPDSVAPAPCWRGDGVQRFFSLRIPASLPSGEYVLMCSTLYDTEQRVALGTVSVGAKMMKEEAPCDF